MLSLIFFAFFAGCTVALPCSETNCTVTAVAVDNGSGAMIGFDSSRHLCADRGAFLVTPVDNGTMAAVFKVCNTSFLGFRQNGSQPQTLCDWRDVDEPDFAVPFQSPFWNSYSSGNFEPNAGMGHLRNKDVFDCSTVTNNEDFCTQIYCFGASGDPMWCNSAGRAHDRPCDGRDFFRAACVACAVPNGSLFQTPPLTTSTVRRTSPMTTVTTATATTQASITATTAPSVVTSASTQRSSSDNVTATTGTVLSVPTATDAPDNVPAIVGGVALALGLLVVVGVVVFILRRKKKSAAAEGNDAARVASDGQYGSVLTALP